MFKSKPKFYCKDLISCFKNREILAITLSSLVCALQKGIMHESITLSGFSLKTTKFKIENHMMTPINSLTLLIRPLIWILILSYI